MNILFVCTGNTCRSPMAQAIAQSLTQGRPGYDRLNLASAGMAAEEGATASGPAMEVCQAHGLSLADHRSRPLTTDMVAAADRIYTMSRLDSHMLARIVPQAAQKIQPLADHDISDPYGGDQRRYQACYKELEAAIRARLPQWKGE